MSEEDGGPGPMLRTSSAKLLALDESLRASIGMAAHAANLANQILELQPDVEAKQQRWKAEFAAKPRTHLEELSDEPAGWDEVTRRHLERELEELRRAPTPSGKLYTVQTVTGGPLSLDSNWQRIATTLAQRQAGPGVLQFEDLEGLPPPAVEVVPYGARLTPGSTPPEPHRPDSLRSQRPALALPQPGSNATLQALQPNQYNRAAQRVLSAMGQPGVDLLLPRLDAATMTDPIPGFPALFFGGYGPSPETDLTKMQGREDLLQWKLEVARRNLTRFVQMDLGQTLTEVEALRREVEFFHQERDWLYKRIIELECELNVKAAASPQTAGKGGSPPPVRRRPRNGGGIAAALDSSLKKPKDFGAQATPSIIASESAALQVVLGPAAEDEPREEAEPEEKNDWLAAKYRDRLVQLGVSRDLAESISTRLLTNMKGHLTSCKRMLRNSFSSLERLSADQHCNPKKVALEVLQNFQQEETNLLVELMGLVLQANTQLLTASVPPSWEQRTPVKPGQLQPLRRSIMRWDGSGPPSPSFQAAAAVPAAPPAVELRPRPPALSTPPPAQPRPSLSPPPAIALLPTTPLPTPPAPAPKRKQPKAKPEPPPPAAPTPPPAAPPPPETPPRPPRGTKEQGSQAGRRPMPRFQTVAVQTESQEDGAAPFQLPVVEASPPPSIPIDWSMIVNQTYLLAEETIIEGHGYSKAAPPPRKGRILRPTHLLGAGPPRPKEDISTLAILGKPMQLPPSPRSRSPSPPPSPGRGGR